ncbi:MAG: ribosome maturation factor RimM [Alistipes sp.]
MATSAGRINKLFGIDGGVMLSLYGAFPADFDISTPLLVSIDDLEVPLYCERFERRGATGALVAFADFNTQRRVQELLGREFRIEGTDEQDDEFYMEDLIGFSVKAGKLLGRVTDYHDSEHNPLFEMELDGRKVLVPAAEEFIVHIDFKGRTMKLVLPEGLIDL